MINALTELVFILDRSGSMSGLETDTIGGFNTMLRKQKMLPGEVLVTTVLFDDQYELLYDREAIAGVAPIGSDEYFVRGSTALLDAIGKTITKIGQVHKNCGDQQRPDHTLFVITTDGLENASREYAGAQIKKLIERQTNIYGWEFMFLGANIDALATARNLGIREEMAANYHADSEGTALNYRAINDAVSELRNGNKLNRSWKKAINKDFEERGK
ncbi:MAG: hypothetical protein PHC86_08135 [Eubacteriales bacterium]|nr:hypothetical protein [Eubacteriales bacterium]